MTVDSLHPSQFCVSELQLTPRIVAYRLNDPIPSAKIPQIRAELKAVKKLKIVDNQIYFANVGEAKNAVFNCVYKNLNPDYCATTHELVERIKHHKTPRDQVQQLLNSVVLPIMNRDGGSCELVGIENRTALLKLTGTCGSCPSSTATIKGLVEKMCQEFVEGVDEVVQV